MTSLGCLKFNQIEQKILTTYKKGDVLIFKSMKTGKMRNYSLVYLENRLSVLSESHPGFIRNGYLEFQCFDSDGSHRISISMFKDSKTNNVIVFAEGFLAQYSGDFGLLSTVDTIFVDKKKYHNYYRLDGEENFGNDIVENAIKTIFWQEDIGVIKFLLKIHGGSYSHMVRGA